MVSKKYEHFWEKMHSFLENEVENSGTVVKPFLLYVRVTP